MKKILVSALLPFIALSSVQPLRAMPNEPEKTIRDTISQSVVTGQARIDFLNEGRTVPVTKVYMKQLERERATDYKDLSGTVPNLFIPEYGSKMTSSIYIRGLGARIDNPVMGIYVDGIGYFNKNDFDSEFFDIRSVEVFRGPQGTLFGRNTIGGIINITTLSPLSYQGTRAHVGYGNGNSLEAGISHYAGITEDFGISAGAYYRHSDGFHTNKYVKEHPQWSQTYHSGAWADPALCDWSDEAGGRIKAEWRPDGRSHIHNTLSIGWLEQGGFPYRIPGNDVEYNGFCGYRRMNISEGLGYSFILGEYTLSGTTSYRYGNDRMDMDQDYLPLSYFTLVQQQEEHSISQEIILKPGERKENGWDWISGLSFFHKSNTMSAPVTFLQDGIDELMPLLQLLMNVLDEKLIRFRFKVFETQVFQLALDLRNTQPARERRVDVQRFLRHFDLPLFGQKIQRTHIVQAVGKLDDDDTDILRHRDEDLAEVFRLLLFARLEYDLVQLGDAGDEAEDLVAELAADVLLGDGRVLDDVVQKCRRDGGAVQPQLHEDLGDGAGVDEVGLPRGALLPAVRLLGVAVGANQRLALAARIVVVDHL